jgi:hypothetical protein
MNYKKDDYNFMAHRRRMAFEQIAKALGKDHPITKMMGSRAWGRSSFEQGPQGNLQSAIREMAAYDGAFDIMNTWARDNDMAAQKKMSDIYPHRFETADAAARERKV